jgi:CrcB protein
MKQLLIIGLGGFFGAVLRYIISGYVQSKTGTGFPYGTLAVNLVGCLVIGLLSYLVDARSMLTAETRAFILVGLLGALTTFSTLSSETVGLLRGAQVNLALFNNWNTHCIGPGCGLVGAELGPAVFIIIHWMFTRW